MKFRGLGYWRDPSSAEGLVFFAQLLEELLFAYSLDTYKPSAMNASTLCLEARSLIDDIEKELIDRSNLTHVLKELLLNIRKDEVAKSLITLNIESVASKLENTDIQIQEAAIILDIIYSQISLIKYKKKSELLLLDAVANPREKDRIRSLTRTYITTLINLGYSTRFLYPAARMYFYWNRNKIAGPESISGFFDIADGTIRNYVAVFRVNSLFVEIEDSCKVFNVEVKNQLGGEVLDQASAKSFELNNSDAFLVVKNISAMDVFSARDFAERRVEQISTLSGLFHHKEVACWETSALLIDVDTKKSRVVSGSQNPMLMCVDSKIPNAAIKLNSFIRNFSMNSEESFKRYNRAAELHSLALKSDSPENQLLNLWVALETIVPSKLGRSKAKINNIIDSVLPFLSLVYIEALTERLTNDFRVWSRSRFYHAIDGVDGETERHKLLRLLLLPEHKARKDVLFVELGDFHLLRNRAHYFSTAFSSSDKVASILETHWMRVDWQVRRIYRTRNLVVHAGHTPAYIDILIKNVHDYLDVVLNSIGRLASDGDNINTVDEAFKYAEIRYFDYMRELKFEKVAVNANNIDRLVLSARI